MLHLNKEVKIIDKQLLQHNKIIYIGGYMSFTVTLEAIQEWLDDDMSLQTLKNQYTVQEIYDLIENKEKIENDDELYEALLDVMYATRPKGAL